MTIDYMLKRLDILQKASANYAMREKKVEELKVMMEADMKLITSIREEFLQLADEEKEEPGPNPVPEVLPPVTDMEEVQKVTGRGGKPKRIFMRNNETGVEKEFPSKTRAAQFLSISQQYLAMILKESGEGTFKGWWITEVADTPGA